jgi:hypothetical protein
METYRIDMTTCLPVAKSEITDFGGQSHEFFLWHDPANSNRVLVYMTNWTSGLPDADHPGVIDISIPQIPLRSGIRANPSARNRPDLSRFQGRVDLLGG